MRDHLAALLEEDWRPVSRRALGARLAFYFLFLFYAFTRHGAFLFIDSVTLVIHEGGHLLFGWLGPIPGIWGGTILQWLLPLLLAAYFLTRRQCPRS